MQLKYLGMTIDPRLKFDVPVHISDLATKISRSFFECHDKPQANFTAKNLRSLYSSMIHPHLFCGNYFGDLGK